MAEVKDFEKAMKKEIKRHEKTMSGLFKKLKLKLKPRGR